MKYDDQVQHPIYGVGRVQRVYADKSVDVLFSDGERNVHYDDLMYVVDTVSAPPPPSTPAKKTKSKYQQNREEFFYLWTDELSNKKHWIAKSFIADVRAVLAVGAYTAIKSGDLLALLKMKVSDNNRRKIRGACHYMIHELGIIVVSIRAGAGGYFIAETEAERDKYAQDQRKFAASMIRTANSVERLNVADSVAKFRAV